MSARQSFQAKKAQRLVGFYQVAGSAWTIEKDIQEIYCVRRKLSAKATLSVISCSVSPCSAVWLKSVLEVSISLLTGEIESNNGEPIIAGNRQVSFRPTIRNNCERNRNSYRCCCTEQTSSRLSSNFRSRPHKRQ